MDERLVLSNLSVKAGSKAGLFYADDVTIRFLKEHGHDVASQEAASCTYRQEVDFDFSDVVPLVAIPHRVDTIKPVDAVAGVPSIRSLSAPARTAEIFRSCPVLPGLSREKKWL